MPSRARSNHGPFRQVENGGRGKSETFRGRHAASQVTALLGGRQTLSRIGPVLPGLQKYLYFYRYFEEYTEKQIFVQNLQIFLSLHRKFAEISSIF